ncbi:MAG: AAA family ATPase, partial [Steroidobacteraceae bacterium]
EYAVRMQQFEPSQELASLLERHHVTGAELGAFGGRLAQWHQAAQPAQARAGYGTAALVRAQALENFDALQASNAAAAARLHWLQRWTLDRLGQLEELMTRRARSGQVRECHGDLHSGNVVRWDGQLLPFDCVEFEPRLRWIDVISDVAFLFMDLVGRARTDLAHAFLSAYLEQGGDYEGVRLLAFYGVYRALVRAKVDAIALAGHAGGSDPTHRQHLEGRLQTALRLTSSDQAALVLMHGVTASGKSWIAERLIGALPAIRVRSDIERKRLPAATQPALAAQRYSTAATQATYSRVLECAASALEGGQNVVVDATFLDPAQRSRFEALAGRLRRPWLILSCTASRTVLLQRLSQRAQHGGDPSEATREVLDQQLQALQPLGQSECAATVKINTDHPVSIDGLLSTLRQQLGRC